jgi:hypothetical protein
MPRRAATFALYQSRYRSHPAAADEGSKLSWLVNEPIQKLAELDASSRRRVITDSIGYDQPIIVDVRSAAIDHIGDVAVAFMVQGFE